MNELTPSGAVKLETLEGVPMPNFINGSRLRKFEQPLTEEMLQQLHTAKTIWEGQAALKLQAQEEAKERRRQIRLRREARVLIVATQAGSEEDTLINPFLVELNLVTAKQTLKTNALIDLGADCNILSYETWEKLGKSDVSPSNLMFTGFTGESTHCLGSINLKVRV